MPDGITYLALVLGFGFVLIASARLGAGSPTILAGLFPPQAVRDWPIGVQEPDAPRFAVAHLDALRPGVTQPPLADATDSPQLVDLYERPLVPSRSAAVASLPGARSGYVSPTRLRKLQESDELDVGHAGTFEIRA